MQSLSVLHSMVELSDLMRAVARDNDWPRLAELEQRMAGLRESLRRLEPDLRAAADRDAKRQLIEKLIADDREIRAHVDPWMASTRKLLSPHAAGAKMKAAYNAMKP